MRSFAENEEVQQKCIDAALQRSILPKASDTGYNYYYCCTDIIIYILSRVLFMLLLNLLADHNHEPIHLFSSNPEEYRSDILQKIIPLITNPSGKYYHRIN